MGQGHFYVIPLQVDDVMHNLSTEVVTQQILKSIFRIKLFPIEHDGQSRIEVDIIPHHPLHILHLVLVVVKNISIGGELHQGALA